MGPFFVFYSWGLFTQNKFRGKSYSQEPGEGSPKWYGQFFRHCLRKNLNYGQSNNGQQIIVFVKQIRYFAVFVTEITWSNICVFHYSTLKWAVYLTLFRIFCKKWTSLCIIFWHVQHNEVHFFRFFRGRGFIFNFLNIRLIRKWEHEPWCKIKWLRR